MKLILSHRRRESGTAMIAYLVVTLITIGTIAAIAGYISQNIQFSSRRQDMVNAVQFAQGGAAISCRDLGKAYTNTGGFPTNLTASANGSYVKNGNLSTNNYLVYERTISSPFTNQTVSAQIWVTNSTSPSSAKVVASARVRNSVQSAEINVEMQFGYAGAIISTSTNRAYGTGASKGTAQNGNVVVAGGSGGTTRIDGGIIANGSVSSNQCQIDSISQTNCGTASEIPDYTNPGSLYQLFDFNRFIAVADKKGTHYTASAFEAAAGGGAVLEGIIVVDCPKGGSLPSLDTKTFPLGINVRGTLIFNFTGGWKPLDKIVNTAAMNINAANLSTLVPGNPATYPTGYPPTYSNPTKSPVGVDISPAYTPFTAEDDLPALMYNNAVLDIHGNANICGVVYSSSFMEIENKQNGQIQYFKGSLIGGGGIYVENGKTATSIVSYDPNALDKLATAAGRGRRVLAVYRK